MYLTLHLYRLVRYFEPLGGPIQALSWRGRFGRVSVKHDVYMSRARRNAFRRVAFAWLTLMSAGMRKELECVVYWGLGV